MSQTAKITITEALAELGTIQKRIEKRRESFKSYLLRVEAQKDPLEKQGGSLAFVAAARQAIKDLQARHLAIRVAIQQANHQTKITIGERTLTVAEWLTWRKEQAPTSQTILTDIRRLIDAARAQAQRSGAQVISASTQQDLKPQDIIVNLDEKALSEEIEDLETVLGTLDGRLSLINATTTIEV